MAHTKVKTVLTINIDAEDENNILFHVKRKIEHFDDGILDAESTVTQKKLRQGYSELKPLEKQFIKDKTGLT